MLLISRISCKTSTSVLIVLVAVVDSWEKITVWANHLMNTLALIQPWATSTPPSILSHQRDTGSVGRLDSIWISWTRLHAVIVAVQVWQFTKSYILSGSNHLCLCLAINSATLSWSGKLPVRGDALWVANFAIHFYISSLMWDPFSNSQLSCKVFLGGLAWDISEQTLVSQLKTFGNVRVDWPSSGITSAPKGYLYVIFENESQVIF